jgi:hypothetical protein
MATAFNLRKLLHRKAWEKCTISPVNTAAGSFIVSDKYNTTPNAPAFFVQGASAIYRYDGDEDAWLQLPNSGITGTFGAGACGEFRGLGAMGGSFNQTATAGGSASITTNRTIVRSLAGRRIRVVSGLGVGFDGTVLSNTIGANAVITTSGSTTFDATTVFQCYSGSLWFFCPGAGAVGFSVYDMATNAWTARSVTGIPTTFATDGQLTSTMGGNTAFFTGTASAGGASTLTGQVGVAWSTNQWANYQIRITAGTGVGQIRTISSNTGTVITNASAWTINPDATSVYAIEGNDDNFYLIGNGAVTLYKYVVSTNTWSTLSPIAARAGAAAAGATFNWIDSVSGWTLTPVTGAPTALVQGSTVLKQNGRYLFSFRGGAVSTLDIYDIAGNTWISGVAYGNQLETFTAGTASVDFSGNIYIQKEATGRIFRFSINDFSMQAFNVNTDLQGAVLTGQKMFMLPYTDGGTTIQFLYTQAHTQPTLSRMIVI